MTFTFRCDEGVFLLSEDLSKKIHLHTHHFLVLHVALLTKAMSNDDVINTICNDEGT